MRAPSRVLPLALLAAALLVWGQTRQNSASPSEVLHLTNPRDLHGWDGDPRYWSVENGAITGQTTERSTADGPTYLIWRGGQVDDFELRGMYRFEGGDGNSGVQYRSVDRGNYLVTGYQADFEVGNQWSGVLVEMGGRLHLARRGQKVRVEEDGKINIIGSVGNPDELQSLIRPNDWNEFAILAAGNHLVHQINGRTMVDVIDAQTSKAARRGILALQLNRSRPMKIQFKDIRLKRLTSSAVTFPVPRLTATEYNKGIGNALTD